MGVLLGCAILVAAALRDVFGSARDVRGGKGLCKG